MDRECCLSLLLALIGGAALLACGWWPAAPAKAGCARRREKIAWRRIWLPIGPALAFAAALCGWALVEPDPIRESVPDSVILLSLPFALLFARAALRGGWALIADQSDQATATVGLLRPWIVFSPYLAKRLSPPQIEAALAHEQAHARHRDPLRIWLAQLATDLQWPWPQARRRFQQWLIALELARDEEARAGGIEGVDLAEAILASARFGQTASASRQAAALTGEVSALRERIDRLLDAAPPDPERMSAAGLVLPLVPPLVLALALGLAFGELAVRMLFRIAA